MWHSPIDHTLHIIRYKAFYFPCMIKHIQLANNYFKILLQYLKHFLSVTYDIAECNKNIILLLSMVMSRDNLTSLSCRSWRSFSLMAACLNIASTGLSGASEVAVSRATDESVWWPRLRLPRYFPGNTNKDHRNSYKF